MTVSVGYACFPSLRGPQPSMDAVLKEADQALYQAKAAGKNRCVLWQEGSRGDGTV
jgi:PleD family two-component response regulator